MSESWRRPSSRSWKLQPGLHGHGVLARLAHAHAGLRDNVDDRILERMTRAGFVHPRKVGDRATLVGRLGFFQASAPHEAAGCSWPAERDA